MAALRQTGAADHERRQTEAAELLEKLERLSLNLAAARTPDPPAPAPAYRRCCACSFSAGKKYPAAPVQNAGREISRKRALLYFPDRARCRSGKRWTRVGALSAHPLTSGSSTSPFVLFAGRRRLKRWTLDRKACQRGSDRTGSPRARTRARQWTSRRCPECTG